MKKITILFLSCVAAIMVVAAPQSKLATLSPDADTKLHPQVLHALTHDLSKRALPANQEVVRQAPQHRLAPCAKATTETINLTGDGFLVGPEYEVATGEWYIALEAQGYTFRLCWYGDEDDYCGTYTFDDMSMEYSWGWYQSVDMFYEIYFQDDDDNF